jgi:hypothetical protein
MKLLAACSVFSTNIQVATYFYGGIMEVETLVLSIIRGRGVIFPVSQENMSRCSLGCKFSV